MSAPIPPSTPTDPTELARVLSHYDTGVVRRIEPIRRGAGPSVKWAVACEKGPFLLKRRDAGAEGPLLALIQHVQGEAARAGIPVPEAVPVRGGGSGGALALRLDGRLYEMSRFVRSSGFDQTPAACRAAGAMLGRLHGMLATLTIPPALFQAGSGGARGYHRLLRVQTDLVQVGDRLRGEGRKIARHLAEMYALAGERAAAAGVEHWPLQLTHGDWHPGNLLFEGGEVVGLIDFDAVRPAPRALDVAYGVLQFSLTRGAAPVHEWPAEADLGRAGAFLSGYAERAPSPWVPGEAAALAWLMIEALIAEASGPLSATGEFGGVDGLSMAAFIERKSVWLRDHQYEVSSLIAKHAGP